jgi:hypothetical protein
MAAGSNLSVVNGSDGTTKVPISTPVNDTNGNTVVAHLGMTVASGVATPTSAANPLPVAAASLPLPAGAAQDGTDATGVTAPAGGAGIRGWLSGIYSRLGGTITVAFPGPQAVAQSGAWSVGLTGTPTVGVSGTVAVSAASLPLAAGAATAANQPTLHADGGALAHVANFPATQAVSQSGVPWAVSWSGQNVAATQSGTWSISVLGGNATAVKVDGSAVTQPVSLAALPLPAGAAQDGTDATGVTTPAGGAGIRGWLSGIYSRLGGTISVAFPSAQAVAQSGTWTVAVSGTAAVSAATLPLPVGAAVASKQHGFGTAGAPNADVVSVQGVSGGTALTVSGGGAVGSAPVGPPLSVSGVDTAGNKQHLLLDISGRQLIVQAGGSGTDFSANSGAAAATAGNLLLTVPATAARAFVEVQNQSAATLSLVRDDGAGNNQTLILLAPGSGAGSQGAGWSSATFKGRVRVYGTAGAQVAAYQE